MEGLIFGILRTVSLRLYNCFIICLLLISDVDIHIIMYIVNILPQKSAFKPAKF